MVMLLMVKVALPVLNSVTPLGGLDSPTGSPAKVMLEVLKVTPDAAPVPVSGTVWGLPLALSVTDTFADKDPEAAGVKTTLIVQLVDTASELPQLLV